MTQMPSACVSSGAPVDGLSGGGGRAIGRRTGAARGRGGRAQRSRQRSFDVVFYTPWIGSLLSRRNSQPVGGAEVQILMLASTLAARGVRAAVIAYGQPEDLPLQVDGVEVIARPAYRRSGVLGTIREMLALWRALWQAPGGSVVYRGLGFELAVVAAYARLARRRLIFSSANVVDFDCRRVYSSRLAALLFEAGIRLSDVIVVQTEEQVGLCQVAFARTPRLIKSIARPAPPQTGPPEAFLWVGRLIGYKQPLAYLELASALPEARFWMIGVPARGREEQALAQAVEARCREIPNLDLLAARPNADLQELMGRAVASVNTGQFEGMPNVFLEAWARGVPALALSHDPGGAITAHELGGFAGGSMERLVALARAQWQSRNLATERERISSRCIRYVSRHHSPEVIAGQWADLLRHLHPEAAPRTMAQI